MQQKTYSAKPATVSQLPGTKPAETKPEPAPAIVHKHASWPREVWVVLVFMAGIATGLIAYDVASNRNMDASIKAVTAGQAIERAAAEER